MKAKEEANERKVIVFIECGQMLHTISFVEGNRRCKR